MEFRFERDRVVTHNTSQSISTHWWLHPWSIALNEKKKQISWVLTQSVYGKVWWNHNKHSDMPVQWDTHVLLEITEQQDKIHLTIPDVRDQSFGKWQYTSTETINVHTGPAVCLVPFIRHPLSFDLVCHHSLYLTHLNHVHGIEMLWKIDSIIIQSIAAQKKDVTRLSLSPMLFEVQMVCTFL